MLDPVVALLQWLRKAVGGVAAAETGEGDPGSRKARAGGRSDAGTTAAEAAAPAPGRRLRALLVYVGVLLAGGMAGGALAFDLLEELIIYLAVENRQLDAALSAQSKAAAAAKQTLEQTQAKRSEAEQKLAVLRAGERLASAPVAAPQARESAGRAVAATAAAVPNTPKAVDCRAIPSDNITALMDCIHKFNR